MGDMAKCVGGIVITCFIVTAILLLILLPLTFNYVEYYEMAFRRRSSTGRVYTDKVYTAGRYAIGPDYTFKAFEITAHPVYLDDVAIATRDRLEVHISAGFQYFLRKEDLTELHEKYDLRYKPILEKNALDAFKNAATEFQLNDFIDDRHRVEEQLFKVVKERLGGTCCERGCSEDETCEPGCIPRDQCEERDRGLFAEVRYFQLGQVDIPDDVSDQYLQNLILGEQTLQSEFVRQSEVVRLETNRQVQLINNNATETTNEAAAEADLILAYSQANATAITEQARIDGLASLFSRLNLNDDDYKRSFDYLRSVRLMDNAHLTVNFDQLIAGQLKR